jgi:hypothetical protein
LVELPGCLVRPGDAGRIEGVAYGLPNALRPRAYSNRAKPHFRAVSVL